MKLPGLIKSLIFLFVVFAMWLLVKEKVSDAALVLTLAVLIAYTYYTFVLAKDAWTPVASFVMIQRNRDEITFRVQNHSKIPLQCWCDLNITIYGKSLDGNGFYAGESPIELQPYGVVDGHFNISKILSEAEYSFDDMKRRFTDADVKRQLNMSIDFWYNAISEHDAKHNPTQRHYYDFSRETLVLDA